MEEVQRDHTQFLPEKAFPRSRIAFALHCSFGGRRDLGGCLAGSQHCLSQRTRTGAQELQELPRATLSAGRGGAGRELSYYLAPRPSEH